jgi:hypothetical protein
MDSALTTAIADKMEKRLVSLMMAEVRTNVLSQWLCPTMLSKELFIYLIPRCLAPIIHRVYL